MLTHCEFFAHIASRSNEKPSPSARPGEEGTKDSQAQPTALGGEARVARFARLSEKFQISRLTRLDYEKTNQTLKFPKNVNLLYHAGLRPTRSCTTRTAGGPSDHGLLLVRGLLLRHLQQPPQANHLREHTAADEASEQRESLAAITNNLKHSPIQHELSENRELPNRLLTHHIVTSYVEN